MQKQAVLAVLALALGAAHAATCPTASAKSDFVTKKYLGTWFEMKRVTQSWESGGTCTTATYSLADDGYVTVYNRQYIAKLGRYYSITGNATLADNAGGEAKLLVRFPVTSVVSNYWVLDTDYDHYSVVWSCNNDTSASTTSVSIWILSRTPSLANQYWEIVNKVLRDNEVNTTNLATTDQSVCPQVSCNGCSIATSDLDVDEVAGEWHEVKHTNESTGASTLTCTTTELTATSSGMTLATTAWNTSSNASVEIDDTATWENSSTKVGAFKLTGSDVTGNNTAELCILGTDYTGYAVVSKCIEHNSSESNVEYPATGGLWVWTRTGNFTTDQLFAVNKILVSANYRTSVLEDTASSPCPSTSSSTTTTASSSTSTEKTSSQGRASFSGLLIAICLIIDL